VKLPAALHVHRLRAVHHDLGDFGVPDERLQRPQTEDAVPDLLDDLGLLLHGESDLLLVEKLSELLVHELSELGLGQAQVVQLRSERLDQGALDPGADRGDPVRPTGLCQAFGE
jgi:hypothetical protein